MTAVSRTRRTFDECRSITLFHQAREMCELSSMVYTRPREQRSCILQLPLWRDCATGSLRKFLGIYINAGRE